MRSLDERRRERAATLFVALVLDLLFGELPARLHPVVGIGRLTGALASRSPRRGAFRQLAYGAGLSASVLAAAALGSLLLDRLTAPLPFWGRLLVRAALLKSSFAVRELVVAAERVQGTLTQNDLPAARAALRALVSRDTRRLDPSLVIAAVVESLAENASDSAIAPWLAYTVAGLPGAYVYRAANTLDAMIGYRGEYEYLGKCAARCDDLLNLAPSRLTALLIVLGGALNGARPRDAWSSMIQDHGKTASPNAGWPMSAMAGALGAQLEKVDHYRLGESRRPLEPDDIQRAIGIVRAALASGFVILLVAGEIQSFLRDRGGRS